MWLSRYLALLFAALILAVSPSARALPVDAGQAQVEILSAQDVAVPGETVQMALKMVLDPGWHIYWINAGDSGLPPMLTLLDAHGASAGELSFPPPHEQPLEGLMNYGYEGTVVLPFQLSLPDDLAQGDYTFRANAEYLICADICIPEDADLTFLLSLEDTPRRDASDAAEIERALASIPAPISGDARIDRSGNEWTLSIADKDLRNAAIENGSEVRFFPLDHQIEHPPLQPLSYGEDGISLTLTPAAGMGSDGEIAGVVVVKSASGDRTGWELAATPGAPVAGTTGTLLTAAASGGGGNAVSLSVGQLLGWFGFALLGGLILNLMPCVLPVLTIKAMGFVQAAARGESKEMRTHGLAYTAGVLVCFGAIGLILAALKAGGAEAGLGFQLQYAPVVGGLAVLMVLIGLNLMGYFEFGTSVMGAGSSLAAKSGTSGAFFTGLLAAIVGAPCVGPFLGAALGAVVNQPWPVILTVFLVMGLGMALPFLLLSFIPGLSRYLPKPGPWMERLRQAFAFPLFLTALWLLWVMEGLSGMGGVLAVLAISLALIFLIWVFRASDGLSRAKLPVRIISLAAVIGAGLWAAYGRTEPDLIKEPWSEALVNEYVAEGRPVFVDFTARWCVTCQSNKATALHTDPVVRAINRQNVAFLEADWTNRDDVIAAELSRHGRAGVPLYLYYAPGEETPRILPQILTSESVVSVVEDR